MNKLNCVIIEDEPLALDKTRKFVDSVPFLDLSKTFDNALKGLDYLKSEKVDLLFLDINMDELTGIELLESTNLSCHIIITTAYSEFALKGYELNVTDYLLKPFTFTRFLQAVNKVTEAVTNQNKSIPMNFIFIKTENRLEKVMFDDIIYMEGMRDYVRIHTLDKKIMTLQNFKEFENLIPSNIICRVHKSFMVALNKIESIERNRIRIGDKLIPISDSYKDYFYQMIKKD